MTKKESDAEKKLEKVEKKVEKVTEQNKDLKRENQKLRKGLAEAAHSEDFTRLNELYAEARDIENWRRDIKLPICTIAFHFSIGNLVLEIRGISKEDARFYIRDEEVDTLNELRDAFDEALEKRRKIS